MIGTFTEPTIASSALARSARRGSSIEACSAMKPKYRNSRMSSEVSRASQTHHAPHIGLPHKAPVHNEMKANNAPVGAMAVAIMADRKSTRLNSSHQKISYAVFC